MRLTTRFYGIFTGRTAPKGLDLCMNKKSIFLSLKKCTRDIMDLEESSSRLEARQQTFDDAITTVQSSPSASNPDEDNFDECASRDTRPDFDQYSSVSKKNTKFRSMTMKMKRRYTPSIISCPEAAAWIHCQTAHSAQIDGLK